MTLADARALEPGVRIVDAAPTDDRRALVALTDWCGRYSPWVAAGGLEDGGAGGIWLDVTGCAHLFAPSGAAPAAAEDALLADLTGRLAALGYAARAAVADTPGAAWAMARCGTPLARTCLNVPPGRLASALKPLPIAALRLGPAQREGLARLGLRRVGDLLELPRGGLVVRFGADLVTRLDQALGRIDEPISPHRPPAPSRARLAFPEPIARPEDVAAALDRLLAVQCRRLEEAGQGARRMTLMLYRSGGRVDAATIGTSRPSRTPGHLARLFAEQLDRLPEPPADPLGAAEHGIDLMILATAASAPLAAGQTDLDGEMVGVDAVAALADRLTARLGGDAVLRLAPRDSHLPERAQRAVPPLAASRTDVTWPRGPRPIRLLPRPESVDAVAPVPDDPPRLFRWRGRLHRVVRADGPERLAPEWWRAAPVAPAALADATRDYYRVEDSAGGRFWLYREGLYDTAPKTAPRWYLHGLFG